MPHFISKDMFIYDSDIAHDNFFIIKRNACE